MLKMNKKNLFFAVTFLLIGIIGTSAFWVYATPSSTFYVSGGFYPSSGTYTIWREGSEYFAKNGYGQIVYEGTNATLVIQACIDSLTNGGIIYFKNGQYIVATLSLVGKNGLSLIGETRGYGSSEGVWFQLEDDINGDIINKVEASLTYGSILIENINMDANKANQTSGNGINFENVVDVTIRNVKIYNAKESGVRSVAGDNFYFYNSEIANCDLDGVYRAGFQSKVESSVFYGNGRYSIHYSGNQHACSIIDNDIFENDGVADINVNNGMGGTVIKNNYIHDNEHATGNAIWILGVAYGNNDTQIEGNTIKDCYNGILITDGGVGNYRTKIRSNTLENIDNVGVTTGNNADETNIAFNSFVNVTTELSMVDTDKTVKYNEGFVTENSGSSSVSTGGTVTHGLAGTPTSVIVTAGEGSPTDVYLSAVGAVTFAINFGGGGSKLFYWYVEYEP